LSKQKSDEMASWQNGKLAKWKVGKLANGNLMRCQVDQMTRKFKK
jgi:hypothetical protein